MLLYIRNTTLLTFLVKEVNVSIESSRDPPFYAGTSLNLTCKVDLPNTVDPRIINSIQVTGNGLRQDKNHYFIPLDMNDDGTYECRVCLFESHYNRYYYGCRDCYQYDIDEYTLCHYGNNEFKISGKQLLDLREIITT